MTKKNTRFDRALALFLMVCMIVSMAACNEQTPPETTEGSPSTAAPADMTYTITVESEDGNPLEGLGIYVYTDDSLEELVWFAKTNSEGVISFNDAASDSYIAVLSNLPEGYLAEENYLLTGETTEIILAVDPEISGDLSKIKYELGGKMGDFTVTAADGSEYTLSQLLQEKKAVVLNFFYQECAPCKMEFPYLQEAYEKYSDVIEVLAMNPVNTNAEELAGFQSELGLTFPMALCDPLWQSAMQITGYPTTVVIDREGTICLIHTGAVTDAETFERIFAAYSAQEYTQLIASSVEELPELEDLVQEDEGDDITNFANPTEIGGVNQFQVMVKPGEEVFVDVYKVSGMYMQVSDPDVYVVYKNQNYSPTNGAVGMVVTSADIYSPVKLGFGNAGSEAKIFTVNFSPLKGTVNNPYSLELGKVSISVNAGNDQGIYFQYKATESGTLTVQCLEATSGIKYDFVLYNLSTYAYRNMSSDGSVSASGDPTVSVAVRKGDTVQFIVGTLPDSNNSYPAGSFVFQAYMGEGSGEEETETVKNTAYAVTVTDEERNPIAGVNVYLSADGSTTTLITGDDGVASGWLPTGNYTVKLGIPGGYTAYSAVYYLTESMSAISVKLDTIPPVVYLDYTVKTVDQNGDPLAGVLVIIGSSFGITDDNGFLSVNLEKGSYSAMVDIPEGYSAGQMSYEFGDSSELTVVLEKTESVPETTEPEVTESENTEPEVTESENTEPEVTESENTEPEATESEATEPENTEPETTVPDETEPEITEPAVEDTTITYSVAVQDGNGTPLTSGVAVQFLQNGVPVATRMINTMGVASVRMEPGEYTVCLAFIGGTYHYDSADLVLSETVTSCTVTVAALTSAEDTTSLYVCGNAYNIHSGSTFVQLGVSELNYSNDVSSYGNNCFFVFIPSEPGTYQISVDSDAAVSYWGSSTFYIWNQTANVDMTDNSFTISVSEGNLANGNVFKCIIGIEVADGIEDSVVSVLKTGEVENKNLVTQYEGSHDPKQFTISASDGKKLEYVDITADTDDYKLVYNKKDGYYHLDSADGPVIMMNLGYDAPYELSIKLMLETTSMNSTYYDEDGYLRGEDFTSCMSGYVACIDKTYGLYPLTKDLMHMVQEHGNTHDWWTEDGMIFGSVKGLNTELAWMYACCYVPAS